MVNRKLGNVGNLGIFFPSFLLPSFRFSVLGQSRKVGRERVGKRILRFPSFRPGRRETSIWDSVKNFNLATEAIKIWSKRKVFEVSTFSISSIGQIRKLGNLDIFSSQTTSLMFFVLDHFFDFEFHILPKI